MDLPGDFKSVHHRHANIDYRNVRFAVGHQSNCVEAVVGGRDFVTLQLEKNGACLKRLAVIGDKQLARSLDLFSALVFSRPAGIGRPPEYG